MKYFKIITLAIFLLVLAVLAPRQASAQWYSGGFGGFAGSGVPWSAIDSFTVSFGGAFSGSFNPYTDALYIDGVRVDFFPPLTYDNNNGGGGYVSMDKTCADGTVVAADATCPPTTKVCSDGSTVAVDATCPPTTKICPDGSVVPVSSACPPQTKTCPDGSVIPVDEQCPVTVTPQPTCQDHAATNYGGPLPCSYPPQLCFDASASNFGQPLPCTYAPVEYCNDPAAMNHGAVGACAYPPAVTKCQDPLATNYNMSLPCAYPPICSDSNAINYGEVGGCAYPPVVRTCQDPAAINFNGDLPCDYAPAPVDNPGVPSDNPPAVVVPDPSGFTLGGDNATVVRFLGGIGADSQRKTLQVNPFGGFNSDVSVSVQSSSCPSVSGYSFDSDSFAPSPSAVMSYQNGWYVAPSGNIGLSVSVRFSKKISSNCDVTFGAVGGGSSDSFTMTVYADPKDPRFSEI